MILSRFIHNRKTIDYFFSRISFLQLFSCLRACGFAFHSIEFDRHSRLCTILKNKKRKSFRRSVQFFVVPTRDAKINPTLRTFISISFSRIFRCLLQNFEYFLPSRCVFFCVPLSSKLGLFWFTKHFSSLAIFMISPLPLLLPYEIYYSWIWVEMRAFADDTD